MGNSFRNPLVEALEPRALLAAVTLTRMELALPADVTLRPLGNEGAGDLDGDGDLDLVDFPFWYEDVSGSQAFQRVHVLEAPANPGEGTGRSMVLDLDGDAIDDILFLGGSGVYWYPGQLETGPSSRAIHLPLRNIRGVVDFDGNDRLDFVGRLLTADGESVLAVYRHSPESGRFEPPLVVPADLVPDPILGHTISPTLLDDATITRTLQSWNSVRAGDLDGDGSIELLTANYLWTWDAAAQQYSATPIDLEYFDDPDVAGAGLLDRDQDGDLDWVTAGTWQENLGGLGPFGPTQPEPTTRGSRYDVDLDGDLDWVVTPTRASTEWFENIGGPGTVNHAERARALHQILDDPLNQLLHLADFDGDGDVDALRRENIFSARLLVYENEGTPSWEEHLITSLNPDTRTPLHVTVQDISQDGLPDLTLVQDHVVLVLRNGGEDLLFDDGLPISQFGDVHEFLSFQWSDLDSDGDLDFVFASSLGGAGASDKYAVGWYENVSTADRFAFAELDVLYWFAEREIGRPERLDVGDFDHDGHLDVLIGAVRGPVLLAQIMAPDDDPNDLNGDGQVDAVDIAVLRNTVRSSTARRHALGNRTLRYDLNGDRAVSSIDERIYLQERLQAVWGDANLDGVFDSHDLANVFAAGQYEDAFLANSDWATGDWNGDGEFDSADLILAFQAGGYQRL